MFGQAHFIPLYFDEEEADLWQALQRIEPEKRSSFIKKTLRQALLSENDSRVLNLDENLLDLNEHHRFPVNQKEYPEEDFQNPDEDLKEYSKTDQELSKELNHESIQEETPEENQGAKEFSLEDLFSEAPVSNPNAADPLPSKGYEYMMKHIIGTEEDKEVIKFLQGNTN